MDATTLDEEEVLEMLAKPIVESFRERFKHLTAPQLYAIPKILAGKNVLLIATTGSGKTEAALLPILSKMLIENVGQGVKLLYITPLRALNRDLLDRIDWWAQKLDFKVAVRHGDTAQRERRIQTLSPPDILITTPETLQVILTAKVFRNYLRSVRWVIVDEVHELATDKRGAQLAVALERLRLITGLDFQRIGLSATIGSPEKIAEYLVGVGRECEIIAVPVPKDIKIDVIYPSPIREDYELAEKIGVFPEVAARLRTIKKLIDEHESTLIFTNTRPLAEILTNRFRLWDQQVPLGIHHGSLSKTTRVMAEHGLKTGELVGIICTSSLELGIDVGRIELCIQYNSPREVTRLIQRVGRSGHSLEKIAKGVVVVMDSDDALESIVIARKSRREELEEARIPVNCLDVLMHQIAGLIIEYGKIKIDEVLAILKKTYTFKDISKEDVKEVLQHMISLGIVEVRNDDTIVKPRRSMELYEYYFTNLSMIPEEHQYLVIDQNSGESIGILDEEFVAEHGEPGTRFILTGRAWEILDVKGDRIYVASLEDYEGAVPSWVGDEIPVPFEVAQEVGLLRREYLERRMKGEERESIIRDIAERYMVGYDVVSKAFREIEEHLGKNIPVPTDKTVLLEYTEPYVILHIHGGLRANRTIQKTLSYHMAEKIGTAIHGQQNPYRIVFRSKHITDKIVLEALREVLEDFEEKVFKAVESSSLFKRRLVHVARKMGIIKSEASITEVNINQLVEALRKTVVYREALNYTIFHDFDLERAKKILEDIVYGRVELRTWINPSLEPSPLSKITLSRFEQEGEITSSEGMKRIVITSVRNRLLYESWVEVCVECFEHYRKIMVKDMKEKIVCPVCGSTKIGVTKYELEEVLGIIARRGKTINKKERKILMELKRNAILVEKYGRAAVIVLSARGLTLKERVEILKNEPRETIRLIELIIEAEKKALQRKFQ
ncbi:MAG: DEAD/DEAH box helicase [Nitrososphaerota archaeon]